MAHGPTARPSPGQPERSTEMIKRPVPATTHSRPPGAPTYSEVPMSTLHPAHRLARQGVGGAESQLPSTSNRRCRGRRALRGVALLVGLLGSLAALAASGVRAYADADNSLDFYSNVDGSPTWNPGLV